MHELRFILELLLTTYFCGIIGHNRQSRGTPIGLRTHVLVGLSAFLMQAISTKYYLINTNGDIMRLAGQFLTGIGFVCSGVIFKGNGSIKGLTTSVSGFLCGCVGIAIGLGFYFETAMVVLICYLILADPFKLDNNHT